MSLQQIRYYLQSVFFELLGTRFWKALLQAFGLITVLQRIVQIKLPDINDLLRPYWGGLLCLSAAFAFWSVRPRRRITYQLKGRDVFIEIYIGDVFDLRGAIVIGSNTTFDTEMTNRLISPESIQGQFTRKFYDRTEHLDHDLSGQLASLAHSVVADKAVGKTKRYEIGTVCRVSPKGRNAYLVAIANINSHGTASGELEHVLGALPKLWTYIGERGAKEPIVVPVLGTGATRLAVPRETIIREIIRSFVAACSEKSFCENLSIVVSPSDFVRFKMNYSELDQYVKHVCAYAEFPSPSATGRGTAVWA